MSKILMYWITLQAVLSSLGGCATAGGAFPRPNAETAVVGQTTKSQIRQTFGPPHDEHNYSSASPIEGTDPSSEEATTTNTRTRLGYFFGDPMATSSSSGAIAQRRGDFYFAGDKLVSYRYSSTFKADSTDFNESLVTKLERDKTTPSEAEQILGKPSGMGIRADTGDDVGKQRYYSYWYVEVNKTEHIIIEKKLYLFFNPDNVLTDFKLNTTRRPYKPRNSATAIPIFIPYK